MANALHSQQPATHPCFLSGVVSATLPTGWVELLLRAGGCSGPEMPGRQTGPWAFGHLLPGTPEAGRPCPALASAWATRPGRWSGAQRSALQVQGLGGRRWGTLGPSYRGAGSRAPWAASPGVALGAEGAQLAAVSLRKGPEVPRTEGILQRTGILQRGGHSTPSPGHGRGLVGFKVKSRITKLNVRKSKAFKFD